MPRKAISRKLRVALVTVAWLFLAIAYLSARGASAQRPSGQALPYLAVDPAAARISLPLVVRDWAPDPEAPVRLVVLEAFLRATCPTCQRAGAAIEEELAPQYAGEPVLLLEYAVDDHWLRNGRWWHAYGGTSVALPMVMVDSGQQFSYGYRSFAATYGAMVDTALERPPRAELAVTAWRSGDRVSVQVDLTNLAEVPLGPTHGATVWAVVYETFGEAGAGRVTNRFVRGEAWQAISPELSPGATARYTLETTPLSGVAWENLRVVVIADYRPGGASSSYDTLQAAIATVQP